MLSPPKQISTLLVHSLLQQEDLIVQLQEQHFQQYMQQVYQQQLLHQQQQYQQIQAMQAVQKTGNSTEAPPTNGPVPPSSVQQIPPTALPAANHVQTGPVVPPPNTTVEATPEQRPPNPDQDAREENGEDEGKKHAPVTIRTSLHCLCKTVQVNNVWTVCKSLSYFI